MMKQLNDFHEYPQIMDGGAIQTKNKEREIKEDSECTGTLKNLYDEKQFLSSKSRHVGMNLSLFLNGILLIPQTICIETLYHNSS